MKDRKVKDSIEVNERDQRMAGHMAKLLERALVLRKSGKNPTTMDGLKKVMSELRQELDAVEHRKSPVGSDRTVVHQLFPDAAKKDAS